MNRSEDIKAFYEVVENAVTSSIRAMTSSEVRELATESFVAALHTRGGGPSTSGP